MIFNIHVFLYCLLYLRLVLQIESNFFSCFITVLQITQDLMRTIFQEVSILFTCNKLYLII